MRRECNIKARERNGVAIIEILGDLTAAADRDMDAAYKEACGGNPKKILLKFDGKSRVNSAGIAIVINLVIAGQENDCEVLITGVSKHYRKIFELVGLTKYTTIVESEEEVIGS